MASNHLTGLAFENERHFFCCCYDSPFRFSRLEDSLLERFSTLEHDRCQWARGEKFALKALVTKRDPNLIWHLIRRRIQIEGIARLAALKWQNSLHFSINYHRRRFISRSAFSSDFGD